MKKIFLARMVVLTMTIIMGSLWANAQSTVYVFVPALADEEATMTINGGKPIDIRGPFQKFMLGAPIYYPAVKKCILNEKGETSFVITLQILEGVGAGNKAIFPFTLNLSNSSIHYIEIKKKLKILDEKDGQKLLKSSKYKHLPDYNDNSDL